MGACAPGAPVPRILDARFGPVGYDPRTGCLPPIDPRSSSPPRGFRWRSSRSWWGSGSSATWPTESTRSTHRCLARPSRPNGAVLFTGDDVFRGQLVFEKYGLMEYGTIFGHGAYLGPDFTADYIERAREAMGRVLRHACRGRSRCARRRGLQDQPLGCDPRRPCLHARSGPRPFASLKTTIGAGSDRPRASAGCAVPPSQPAEMPALVAYFSWSAWVATANRPGKSYSYTNNWPPAPAVGNTLTAGRGPLVDALAHRAACRHRRDAVRLRALPRPRLARRARRGPAATIVFREPGEVRLTPAQRSTVWFFLVVVSLFLLQGLCGGANAHYHAEPSELLRDRCRVVVSVSLDADLAPSARSVLRRNCVSGDRDLHRADDRGEGAAPSEQARHGCSSSRSSSWSRVRWSARR